MTMKSDFLARCEAFINSTGMTATEFGERASSDRNLMTRLRAGKNITLDKADAVLKYINDYKED